MPTLSEAFRRTLRIQLSGRGSTWVALPRPGASEAPRAGNFQLEKLRRSRRQFLAKQDRTGASAVTIQKLNSQDQLKHRDNISSTGGTPMPLLQRDPYPALENS